MPTYEEDNMDCATDSENDDYCVIHGQYLDFCQSKGQEEMTDTTDPVRTLLDALKYDPVLTVEHAELYWSAIHIYRVEGMSDAQVRTNATRERKMHGPATLIVQHLHPLSEHCNKGCKAKTVEDDDVKESDS